jgi:2-iminobutanoate/2-iminopropanoate deaminase
MSNKKYIETGDGLPNWSNPISHAVVANNMCFVSGQLAIDADGDYVPGTALEEAKMAFANFFSAVENAEFQKSDVVFIDIAFNDLEDLPQINQLYIEIFPEGKRPARTIYQAAALPFGGKIKISGTAVKDL